MGRARPLTSNIPMWQRPGRASKIGRAFDDEPRSPEFLCGGAQPWQKSLHARLWRARYLAHETATMCLRRCTGIFVVKGRARPSLLHCGRPLSGARGPLSLHFGWFEAVARVRPIALDDIESAELAVKWATRPLTSKIPMWRPNRPK